MKFKAKKFSVSLPVFAGDFITGEHSATLHAAHYDRLVAVVAACRTGDPLLMKLALAHLDRLGSGPEKE